MGSIAGVNGALTGTRVGIGTSNPVSILDISGALSMYGYNMIKWHFPSSPYSIGIGAGSVDENTT